jgi:hypothetical protein
MAVDLQTVGFWVVTPCGLGWDANILEEHAAPIFRVEVIQLAEIGRMTQGRGREEEPCAGQ